MVKLNDLKPAMAMVLLQVVYAGLSVLSSLAFLEGLNGVLASGLAFFLQAWCIAIKGPLYSAMFNPLCTVIATVISCAFLSEKLYVGSLVGAISVIIGLYILLCAKGGDSELGNSCTVTLIAGGGAQSSDDHEEPLLTPY